MDTTAVGLMLGPVTLLTQALKYYGLPRKWAPLACSLLALVAVALYVVQQGAFRQAEALSYFFGWITLFCAASGVYGFLASARPEDTPVASVAQPKGRE